MEPIVNKVADSGLVTIDLEALYSTGERVVLDITDWLFEGLILKEKDFRERLKTTDWSAYGGKHVALICSADAIVPTWAYMLLATALRPFAATVHFGDLERLEEALFQSAIEKIDVSSYTDQRVVIKGCSNVKVPVSAYVTLTALLQPVVKSIFYGEPCSTVPVFKRKGD
ncbi:MAG: DUF2480 family protein [Bacteroidota bacterium]